MRRHEGLRRIGGHGRRHRNIGNRPPARHAEMQRAVGVARDLIALLVDRPVMAPAEEREVVEPGRAAIRPVVDVVALRMAQSTARKAASAVPRLEHPPERGRDGPRASSDVQDVAVLGVTHDDPRRVTRQAPGRFS